MNKRFDWMTPDEAEKELEPGEHVWVLWNASIEPGRIEISSRGSFRLLLIDSWYMHPLAEFDRICRAIVPEVPSE